MYEALFSCFHCVAIGLVGLIVLQQGKGADMGASFGATLPATLFGSSGSGSHDPNDWRSGIGDAVLHHQ